MKRVLAISFIFFLMFSMLFAQGDACYDRAVNWLKINFPPGYKVVQKTQRSFFVKWLNCSYAWSVFNVGTAVHESVHMMSFSTGNMMNQTLYVLQERFQTINRVKQTYFYRSEVAKYLNPADKDMYYNMYLTGQSGAQGLNMVLDELNAYSWSVKINTIIAKNQGFPAGIRTSERDGLVTFMLYTALYIKCARLEHQADYKKMSGSAELKNTIKVLWANAESVLNEAKQYPALGMNDGAKMTRLNEVIGEVKTLLSKPNTGNDSSDVSSSGFVIQSNTNTNPNANLNTNPNINTNTGTRLDYNIIGNYPISFSNDRNRSVKHFLFIKSIKGNKVKGVMLINMNTYGFSGSGTGLKSIAFNANLQVLRSSDGSQSQPFIAFKIKFGGNILNFRMAPVKQESGILIWGGQCKVTSNSGVSQDITIWSQSAE